MSKTLKKPDIVCLANVEAKPISWLWPGYLAKGMLALLSGDPGSGKTFLSLAIASELSRGRLPNTQTVCDPVDTLYMSNENAPEYIVRPRFDAQGGDPHRLHILKGSLCGEGDKETRTAFSFEDVDVLSMALENTNSKLVVIDPLQSYLGSETDAHRANQTRPLLDGLAEVAERHMACILLLRHLNKNTGGKAVYRGLGSIDFTGAARMEMLAGCDLKDANLRALFPIKNNIAALATPLGYEIEANQNGNPRLKWTGASELTLDRVLGDNLSERTRPQSELAVDFLQKELMKGPKYQQDLVSTGGFRERTLQRAFKEIHGRTTREGERGAVIWALPKSLPDRNGPTRQTTDLTPMQ